jgi:hypothetical protein
MILYPCQKNTPVSLLLKLGFYIFLVSLGVIFMHDCVLHNDYERKKENHDSNEFIDGINGKHNVAFGGSGDKIAVVANTNIVHDEQINNDKQQPDYDNNALFEKYDV